MGFTKSFSTQAASLPSINAFNKQTKHCPTGSQYDNKFF